MGTDLQSCVIVGDVNGPARRLPQRGKAELKAIAYPGFFLDRKKLAEFEFRSLKPRLEPPGRLVFAKPMRNGNNEGSGHLFTGSAPHPTRWGRLAFGAADQRPDSELAPSRAATVHRSDRRRDRGVACWADPVRAEPVDREEAPASAASGGLGLGAQDHSSQWATLWQRAARTIVQIAANRTGESITTR